MFVVRLLLQLFIDPFLSVDLVKTVFDGEPLVIVPVDAGSYVFFNSAVRLLLFSLEVVDVVNVVIYAMCVI